MKNYESPELTVSIIENADIITTSDEGTETTPKPENDGVWDLDIG